MSIRVLLVDDHVLVREGIRRMLERTPELEVVGEAGDGDEAVTLSASLQPDVVLMDVAMPGVNGVEATRRIKALLPRTSVLVLTAYDEDGYVFALLEAGAAGYLLKSSPAEQLVGAIQAVHAGEAVLSPAVARKVVARVAGGDGAATDPGVTLHGRELEVLRLAAAGHTNQAIAATLALSPRTVQQHLAHVFEKLCVASRTEAVVEALKRGWLRLEEIE